MRAIANSLPTNGNEGSSSVRNCKSGSRRSRVSCWLAAILLISVTAAQVPKPTRPAVIGLVMSSSDTTIAGVRALPSTPIMTGDRLRVGAGAAVIELGKSTRITLGRNTEATFEGKQNDRMTLLSYGGLSFHRPKEGVEFRLRAGNISIVPISGLDTRAEVEMSGKSLVVASREGSVRVEGNGRIVEVAKGKAIKFFPETYQTPGQAASPGPSGPVPPQIPASAGNTRGGPHWGHWAWCMVTGSALGAIPPLVSEHSISPHRWEWVFVPAGGAVGGLICELIPEPPPPPPPTCQLSLTQSPAPGMPFTLSWASQNATTLNIQPARGPVRVPSGSVPVAGPGKFIMTATGPGGTDTCKVDACGIPDVQSLLLHVPVSPSSSRIYVTGPYQGGAMLVEDGVDTSSRTPPPVARLQAGLSGEPGSFCAYWIDDAVIRIGDKGPAPPNYHRVTTKFDHAVRMAWTKQGDPTRYGVTPAHRTMTVYPYGGVKPAPYALIGDATVGRAPVTFGIGDFAAEPVVSRKAVAPPLLGGMDNRSRAPGVIETALSFAQPFLPAALRPAQAADRGCLSQALVVDGGDKKGWVMDLAAAEAADAGLMDVWLRGQNFKVNRISQYW